MTAVGFSASLRTSADALWAAQHAHPFVRGIADGTLRADRFEHYVRQDYLFLVEYARMLALGAARAPDLETMRRFAGLTEAILGEEMDLHRAFAAELGIPAAALEAEVLAPTTRAYTDHLVRTAAMGSFEELAAALLPCMWGYAEIGARLSAGPAPDGRPPAYERWIATYADPGFADLAAWCRGLVDDLAAGLPVDRLDRMRTAFVECSRLELAFWEMGWTLER